jgi:hypothetical protein
VVCWRTVSLSLKSVLPDIRTGVLSIVLYVKIFAIKFLTKYTIFKFKDVFERFFCLAYCSFVRKDLAKFTSTFLRKQIRS